MLAPSNHFLRRMWAAYGPPHKNDFHSQEAIIEYARHVQGYSKPEMDEAADALLRSRKWKTWPTIGEMVQALQQAARIRLYQAREAARKDEPYTRPSPEMRARVAELTRQTVERLKLKK